MNRIIPRHILTLGCFFIASVLIYSCASENLDDLRSEKRFTQNWQFHLGDVDSAQAPGYADSTWQTLDVPHDWSIEGEFSKDHPAGTGGGALPGGVGWYRKTFTVPAADSGKTVFVKFDGVYRNSEVWINGHYLGKRPNGYITFRYELTPYLNYGDQENVIAVRVDNSNQPNSRWYSGSGIYRNVWLIKTNKLHVDQWGTNVTTPEVSEQEATIHIETKVRNQHPRQREFMLTTVVYDSVGNEVARTTSQSQSVDSTAKVSQQLTVNNPDLWSTHSPSLYDAVSIVKQNGQAVDRYETQFGIRKFHFERKNGFFLNGKQTKILGVCEHHDLGALGAALNKRAIERRLEILKEMGVNAIRTAHNPPSPELLELTDEMGFIVMNEAFDAWKKNKVKYGYHEDWEKWHKKDLRDLVLRDRNHPSVMIWSIGNEILEQFDSTGAKIAKELAGIVREYDQTRPITAGLNDPKPHNPVIKSGALDLIGYNYHNELFDDFLEKFPGEKFIATETTSALATRGEYDMPSDSIRRWPEAWDEPFTKGNDDFTVSSYDNVSTPWGSTHEEAWASIKGKDHLSGMFIWTGFDYLGEPTPYGWPARSSYFGILDLAGFPKNAYYMYQSEWTNKDVLHIFPHWNWQKGDTVDVWAYSSAENIELFLNGESLGKKTEPENQFHTMWRVPYEPGTIKAVAYTDGEQVMTEEIHTAGDPHKIKLTADRTRIEADGRDLSYIKVAILDKEGNVVPRADNLVDFKVEGQGRLRAVSSGNPVSHESFQASQRKAFNGLCRAIIQSTETPGEITVTATSDGLQSADITITTH